MAIDLCKVFNEGDDDQIEKLEHDCFEKQKSLKEIEASIENLLNVLASGGSSDAAQKVLNNKLNVYVDQKQTLEKERLVLKAELNTCRRRNETPEEINKEVVEFYKNLDGLTDDELYIARSKLAQLISSFVDKVYIFMDERPKGTFKKRWQNHLRSPVP